MEDLFRSFLDYQDSVDEMESCMKDFGERQKDLAYWKRKYNEIKNKGSKSEELLNGQIAQAMKDGDAGAVARLVEKRDKEKAYYEYEVRCLEAKLKEVNDELRKFYNYDEEHGISKLQAEVFSYLSPAEIECFKREGTLVKDANGTEFYKFPSFNISDIIDGFMENVHKPLHPPFSSCRVSASEIRDQRMEYYGFDEDDYHSHRDEISSFKDLDYDYEPYRFVVSEQYYSDILQCYLTDKQYSYEREWINYLSVRLPMFLKGRYINIYATKLETEAKDLLRRADQVRAWAQEYGVQESADESEG